MKKQFSLKPISLFIFIVLALMGSCLQGFAQTTKQTIAILPFEMISSSQRPHIQKGALQMLHSRLLWKNHIEVVDKNTIQTHLNNMGQIDTDNTIERIANLTGCNYVLTGSITHFANAFSIDTKIYDIKNNKYLTFFEQSKIIDDVIPKLNIIAAKINKTVFKRETVIYENLVKKEKEKAMQWKRQNPEKLMPVFPQGEQPEKSSFWKIWEYL